jgi:hypothetical protein
METGPAWARRETIETTISAFGAGFVGLGVGLVLVIGLVVWLALR